MCGIAGVMTTSGRAPASTTLDGLEAALAHRGPDGTGRHLRAGTGLVQTRLAIIDLNTGDQPFTVEGEGGQPLTLVANGEIYNYLELQKELGADDLKTASDCEPPLHLYARLGIGYAERLRGMYAIAIDDAPNDQLVLSRDPFGIKPLYYAETADAFAFASEPQALLRTGIVTPELNRAAAAEVLNLQFSTGAETPFRGIHRVLPGETLVVRAGRVAERHRIPALPDAAAADVAHAAAIGQLDELFEDSVDIHQRADVPYGMFLSGGIDSSALLAMMKRLNDQPVKAFTVGFASAGVPDERAQAERVAAAAGAEFTAIEFEEADFWRTLPDAAAAMDDPAADYAVLPTYMLAAAAHRAGLKVVLSGEGGDEMFAGYGRYRRATRPRWLGARPLRAAGTLADAGVLRDGAADWRRGIAAAEAAASARWSALQRAQAVDCADWLPNDLLTKLDRCLMAHGVEGRVPYVDTVLAAFAFRLPDALKVRKRLGKWLLRKWLETQLPESRPMSAKRGFTVPVAEWIQARGPALGPLVAGQPGVAEMCRPDAVEALFGATGKAAGQAQWVLLFFALWHDHYLMGKTAGGDVFDTLGAAA